MPPKTPLAVNDLHHLLDTEHPAIIAGDLNCKHTAWNCCGNNHNGRLLFNAADAKGYTVLGPDAPTHYPPNPNHRAEVLDILVHNNLDYRIIQTVSHDDLLSDHQPVLVDIQDRPVELSPRPSRPLLDWPTFVGRLKLSRVDRQILTAADVNALATDLTKAIQDAAEVAKANSTRRTNNYQALPPYIKRLLRAKRNLRKRWAATRCTTLRRLLNNLAERIRVEFTAYNEESWSQLLSRTGKDTQSLYKICRRLTNTPAPVRPLLHPDGSYRYKAEDRAEILADYLEGVFTPNPTGDRAHERLVRDHLHGYFTGPITNDEDPAFFTPDMVTRAIRQQRPRRAPGADQITNVMLRHLPPPTITTITHLFNGIVRTGAFPTIWKEGRVIMLLKAGKDPRKASSYRPITLLPTLSKAFERLLLGALTPHIKPRDEQFGFRAGHSTTLQLTRVIHLITSALNSNERALAVLLDVEKAFDRVWREGLIYKLSLTSAPRRMVRVVMSFLTNRSFRVTVGNHLSPSKKALAGVPQGSCLSPTLYSLYTDDIPVANQTTLALYADDAAYITTNSSPRFAALRMQRALDLLPPWLNKWRLQLNIPKTQAIFFPGIRRLPPPLKIMGTTIEWASRAKYLGVTLDRRLKMKPHTRLVRAATKAVRTKLRPIFNAREIPTTIKLSLYRTYVRSRLTYAAPAWYSLLHDRSKNALQAQQNLTLRTIAQAPFYVRNSTLSRDFKMESIREFVKRLAQRMFTRADASDYPIIRNIAPLHARPPDARARPLPRDLVSSSSSDEDNSSLHSHSS